MSVVFLWAGLKMDFLSLFIFYVIFVMASVLLICKCSGRSPNLPGRVAQGCSFLVPSWLQRGMESNSNRVLYTRSPFFVVLHVVLEAAVYGEYTWEIYGYCSELEFSRHHLLLPYALGAVNLGLFWLCCTTDPGTITTSNQATYVPVYKYDGVMFHKKRICATCQLVKPARSKHCGVCDRCVHRFDHHCVWVNNCIGANNTGCFLIYLITLTLMAADLAVITTTFLAQVVSLSKMLMGSYLDADGQEHAMNMPFVIQHLFLTIPRIVFLLGFLVILFLLIGGYSCFMLYLLLRNQTSNEWCKARQGCLPCCQGLPHKQHASYQNIYSKGMIANILEAFQPTAIFKEKGK
ncbi:palmitoyltransferase ZDHHC4 isoform X2 [Ambystoma mexicanum]|uniref:palmitoyltransferase ZDHHC4 isoform X2 n=1 Tax=Ambystoma mexicanum TaxID=8296 RepID=UPI0037E99E21